MPAVTFLEARLDTNITIGARGGPSVPGRQKVYLPNGRMFQTFTAAMPVHRYDVSHGVRSREDLQTLIDAFYIVMLTPHTGLRMQDPRDYRATRQNSNVSPIGGGAYQLQRVHRFGGVNFYRDIVKPCAAPAVVVYDTAGAALSATVDITTGIVTAASGTPATWSGEFDVPVTFTDDEWIVDMETDAESTAWITSGPIKLEEIRL